MIIVEADYEYHRFPPKLEILHLDIFSGFKYERWVPTVTDEHDASIGPWSMYLWRYQNHYERVL